MENDFMAFKNISATEFAAIWKKFDLDDSGVIDEHELDGFFYEYAKSSLKKEPTEKEHADVKKRFMSAYTKEEKITMRTLAEILLPEDEGFLLLFQMHIPLRSSVTFMEIWRMYDDNCKGYICDHELEKFISDYIAEAGATASKEKLQDYTKSIMQLFDRNGDGHLDLQDMARLLNVTDNFLLQYKTQDGSMTERRKDFETIFKHYDEDNSGALEGVEFDGFVKDMVETIKGCSISARELDTTKEKLMRHIDLNKDGKIQKAELALALGIRWN